MKTKLNTLIKLITFPIVFSIFTFSGNNIFSEKTDSPPGLVENINWSSSKLQIIIGKVMLGKDNQVCVVSKWNSRSRVSYYVYGDFKTILKDKMNKFVKIKGWIYHGKNQTNRWSRKMLAVSILKISDTPDIDD
jgi:hypothetical protein